MSATLQRSSRSGGRQSLFYRDLSSPISAQRGVSGGRFATPGQAAAVSALWRENFSAAAADPPPPPAFTLDDRADFSPEPALLEARSPSPVRHASPFSSPTPSPIKESGSGSYAANVVTPQQTPPPSSNWWSPVNGGGYGEQDEKGKGKGKGSPVDGVVQPGALIMLPPPREVARPEMQWSTLPIGGGVDEEEWVTVYGFSTCDTNLVLREFEKCGVVLKHVPGPRDANWMLILYQNRYDAQKALRKDGMQINSVLMVGVKPADPAQRQFLNERLNINGYGGFMAPLLPKSTGRNSAAMNTLGVYPRPNYPLANALACTDSSHKSVEAVASPAKSVVSKVMDLMFGV